MSSIMAGCQSHRFDSFTFEWQRLKTVTVAQKSGLACKQLAVKFDVLLATFRGNTDFYTEAEIWIMLSLKTQLGMMS